MMDYSVRILTPEDGGDMKAARLEAARREPEEFYLPYKEEAANPDNEWRRRCTETPNDHCAFGAFYIGKLIGSVEIMPCNTLEPGVCMLGRLYVDPQHRGRKVATNLVRRAFDWVSAQDEFEAVIAAVVNGNEASQKVLFNCGFKTAYRGRELFTETFLWPSTGKNVTQTWYGQRMQVLQPRQNLHSRKRADQLAFR